MARKLLTPEETRILTAGIIRCVDYKHQLEVSSALTVLRESYALALEMLEGDG